MQKDWFHGDIAKEAAEDLLAVQGKGTFHPMFVQEERIAFRAHLCLPLSQKLINRNLFGANEYYRKDQPIYDQQSKQERKDQPSKVSKTLLYIIFIGEKTKINIGLWNLNPKIRIIIINTSLSLSLTQIYILQQNPQEPRRNI